MGSPHPGTGEQLSQVCPPRSDAPLCFRVIIYGMSYVPKTLFVLKTELLTNTRVWAEQAGRIQ